MSDLHRKTTIAAILLLVAIVPVGCGPAEAPAEATPVGLPPDVANAAREALSEAIGVSTEQIEIVRANRVEWTNTCLELGDRDEVCGQALTPGWKIILAAEGEEYEIHTDLGADTVRIKQ